MESPNFIRVRLTQTTKGAKSKKQLNDDPQKQQFSYPMIGAGHLNVCCVRNILVRCLSLSSILRSNFGKDANERKDRVVLFICTFGCTFRR